MSGHRLTETTVFHLGGPCRHPPEDYTHLSTCSRSVVDLPFGKRNITLHRSVADGSLEPRSAFHCIEIFNYFHRERACTAFESVPGSRIQRSAANSWKSIAWFVEMHASPSVANREPLRKEEFCEKGSGVRSEKRVEDVRVSLRAKVASRCRRSASPRTGCGCDCRNRLATHARLPRCLHESSCRLPWMLRKRQGTPTKVGLLVAAAAVHDDNNKRCSLPSGSNVILSLSLFLSSLDRCPSPF